MTCVRHLRVLIPGLLIVAGLPALAGPLQPAAGPVASTMKTLSEVEPRTVVNATNTPGTASAVYAINQPGSYCLASDFALSSASFGIFISASNVTLDLQGFSITGGGDNSTAIYIADHVKQVRIHSGRITGGTGTAIWQTGLDLGGQVTVEDVDVANTLRGVRLQSQSALVRRVKVVGTAAWGIELGSNCEVVDSTALSCGSDEAGGIKVGSSATVQNCRVINAASSAQEIGYGIYLGFDSVLRECSISGSSGCRVGIRAGGDCVIENCRINIQRSDAAGIRIEGDGVVIRNNAISGGDIGAAGNAGVGIDFWDTAIITGALIDGNSIKRCNVGIGLYTRFDNTIVRNRFIDVNNTFVGTAINSNVIGPIVTNGGSTTNPLANIAQ